MASSSVTSSSPTESNCKKRRKIDTNVTIKNNQFHDQQNKSQWKSASQHKIYASKLVDALRRRTSNSTVRETADRVLALSGKGRTRWSRAILTNRLKLQMRMIKQRNKTKNANAAFTKRPRKLIRAHVKKRSLLAVEEKARDLSRLVPGCRKITLPNLLEEVGDYIAALEMQVRAMTALTGLLTGSAQSI